MSDGAGGDMEKFKCRVCYSSGSVKSR